MFIGFCPEYFRYISESYSAKRPTVLCKILGVHSVGSHNKLTGKKEMEHVVVMENVFYERNITRTFDLKGSSRARYTQTDQTEDFDSLLRKRREARFARSQGLPPQSTFRHSKDEVLMDDNLMELTKGLPFPLKHLANLYLQTAIENDTEFLSSINVVDYSIIVGIDEDNFEVVVGIIDYMRQYDIIKRVERIGKSVGMIAGQAEPTIVQPSQYKKRFRLAMERNFMSVPDKYDM
jgi:1-phosphatidylinositol-3-phosphate 5-kinase